MRSSQRRVLAGGIGLLLLTVGLVFGYCLPGYVIRTNLISSTLQTLITAQASILAIVFSVVFVATQIVTSKYSPAFIKMFLDSSILRDALYLAIGSILLPLSILSLMPVLERDMQESLFVWNIGVTAAVLVSVAIYAATLINQTAPTNLLRQYRSQLSPLDYRRQSVEAGKENSVADHPVQPVYDLTRSSIQDNNFALAVEVVFR